ncbi:MAG: hypothetical protein HY765_04950, partial [Rhodomicrobium sp.]|nr:hypothetical protein [Rhodomicrobium sp.]
MSQKQAISQTPIDLKPEDEAKAQAPGNAAPEAGAGARAENAQQRSVREPQASPPSPRRIQEGREATVQVTPGTPAARPSAPKRPAGAARPHIPANDDMP